MTVVAEPLLSLSRYYLPVYRPRQLVLERGQGARLWDTQGREFIDLAAGIAVCSLGHNHPALKAALLEQADKLWHTSNMFYSAPPLHRGALLAVPRRRWRSWRGGCSAPSPALAPGRWRWRSACIPASGWLSSGFCPRSTCRPVSVAWPLAH